MVSLAKVSGIACTLWLRSTPLSSALMRACVEGDRKAQKPEIKPNTFAARMLEMRQALAEPLSESLESVRDDYEFIIVDCPPSLGLLTVNALTAADSVLIPVQCEYYALEGLSKLLNSIQLVQRYLNPDLQIEGVLLTMYDERLQLSKRVAAEVKSYFNEKVYDTLIKRNVTLAAAPSFGKPVIFYEPRSTGAENYRSLARELGETLDAAVA